MPMKPMPNHLPEMTPLLAFEPPRRHIEFGCGGGVVAAPRPLGARARPTWVVCSRGESGTYSTPEQRTIEAERAAVHLGATIEFVELDGDAHLEIRAPMPSGWRA